MAADIPAVPPSYVRFSSEEDLLYNCFKNDWRDRVARSAEVDVPAVSLDHGWHMIVELLPLASTLCSFPKPAALYRMDSSAIVFGRMLGGSRYCSDLSPVNVALAPYSMVYLDRGTLAGR